MQVNLWKQEGKDIKNLDYKKNFDKTWDLWVEDVMQSVNARKNRTMSMFLIHMMILIHNFNLLQYMLQHQYNIL